jgi:nudix-type nucleoside diphosphatase (YffH/AdpP family)
VANETVLRDLSFDDDGARLRGSRRNLAEKTMNSCILEREVSHAGYLTIERVRLRLADGAEAFREVERHGDAAAVLPYDAERRCALVIRLLRAPVLIAAGELFSEEACAGMIELEDATTTAHREADEELGVDLPSLEFIARVWSSPGVSTERQSLFLAPYQSSDRTGKGGGAKDEHEGITVVERSLPGLAFDADQGRIADAKLLTLVLALRLRRPELFAPFDRAQSEPCDCERLRHNDKDS